MKVGVGAVLWRDEETLSQRQNLADDHGGMKGKGAGATWELTEEAGACRDWEPAGSAWTLIGAPASPWCRGQPLPFQGGLPKAQAVGPGG